MIQIKGQIGPPCYGDCGADDRSADPAPSEQIPAATVFGAGSHALAICIEWPAGRSRTGRVIGGDDIRTGAVSAQYLQKGPQMRGVPGGVDIESREHQLDRLLLSKEYLDRRVRHLRQVSGRNLLRCRVGRREIGPRQGALPAAEVQKAGPDDDEVDDVAMCPRHRRARPDLRGGPDQPAGRCPCCSAIHGARPKRRATPYRASAACVASPVMRPRLAHCT